VARRDPARAVRLQEQGRVTQHEAVWELFRAAAETSAEDVAAALPADWLLLIRSHVASPPRSVAETMTVYHYEHTSAEHRTNDRWLTYEGMWRWHRYFESRTG
jgi:hypothetical protein